MRNLFYVIALLLSCAMNASSQSFSRDYAVELSAVVNASTTQIQLSWPVLSAPTSNGFDVYRKLKSGKSWGSALANLSGGTGSYTDKTVKTGIAYEYKVVANYSNTVGSATTYFKAYGYILSGIEIPVTENRGRILLVVEDSVRALAMVQLNQLIMDMRCDGWLVHTIKVNRGDKVKSVKSAILTVYNQYKDLRSLFLIGRVPVPYSGFFNPDGHTDHIGAWPSDAFYGDMDGTWTDNLNMNPKYTGNPTRIINNSGDGKYDDDIIPSAIELEVGRIDFNDMHGFAGGKLTGDNLIKPYLQRDHDFRNKVFTAQERALVYDNFGPMGGEAFLASGVKSYAPMFGSANVKDLTTHPATMLDSLRKYSYLGVYGSGAGSYTSAAGISGSDSFKNSVPYKGVFNMYFGSYFGDWDNKDNFLRAPLASNGYALTNCWSGRPHWYFHHMALGETVGYSASLSQQDTDIYFRQFYGQAYGALRNNSFHGDPTLRLHSLYTPKKVTLKLTEQASPMNARVALTWNKAREKNLKGYIVYRTDDWSKVPVRLTTNAVTDTFWTDSLPLRGMNHYIVKAEVLTTSASGSYYNLSEGVTDSVKSIYGFSAVSEIPAISQTLWTIYPNPVSHGESIKTQFGDNSLTNSTLAIIDITGRVLRQVAIAGNTSAEISTSGLSAGVYFIQLQHQGTPTDTRKIIIR